MTLRIADEEMTSDATAHTAVRLPGGGWSVSWLPGLLLDRDEAVTAMMLAEVSALIQLEGQPRVADHTHRLWPHVDAWAGELGLTGLDAVVRVSERPEADQVQPAGPVRWVACPAPGGWVCGAADPAGPDGVCGMPVESEACPIHHDASYAGGAVPLGGGGQR